MDKKPIHPKPFKKGVSRANERYKHLRNYQAWQQAVYVCLLNSTCEITFNKPVKSCKTTTQFFSIKKLNFGGDDVIDVDEFLQSRSCEKLKRDKLKGVSTKTASRRYDNNKFGESLHLLMDILTENGYFINARKSNGRNNSDCIYSAKEIFYKTKLIATTQDIVEYGEIINNYLLKCVKSNDFFCPCKK
ncbi:TATA-binding protein-associated phosphoprotein [Entamoeba marina]